MIGHRIMGISLLSQETSRNAEPITIRRSRSTILLSIVRWRPVLVRTRGVTLDLSIVGLWLLGYPEAALADADHALTMRAISAKLRP